MLKLMESFKAVPLSLKCRERIQARGLSVRLLDQTMVNGEL